MIRSNLEEHPLVLFGGVLGLGGFTPGDGMVAALANGDNNFLLFGIAENSLLIIDKNKHYQPGKLNVYCTDIVDGEPAYKLSLIELADYPFVGRVVMTINQYE